MAFNYFDKALNIINNIALEYLQKTLENQSKTAHSLIVDTYIHMGKVYTAMNKNEKA
jgi:hypothetical protein